MRLEVSDACCSVQDSASAAQGWAVLHRGASPTEPRRVGVGGRTRLMSNTHSVRSEGVSVDAPVGRYYSPLPLPGDEVTDHGVDGTGQEGQP